MTALTPYLYVGGEIRRAGRGDILAGGGVFDPATLSTAHYGPVEGYTMPSGTTDFTTATVWSTIVSTINNAAAGTKFWFAAGDYRVTSHPTLKSDMEFHGEYGARLLGSKALPNTVGTTTQADAGTHWAVSGDYWYIGNQTQRVSGSTPDNYSESISSDAGSRARATEMLIVDDVPLVSRRTLATTTLATHFYFDYSANRIYMRVDPTGKTIETSVYHTLFNGGDTLATPTAISGVLIKNLAVSGFGAQLSSAPVYGKKSERWVVENCDVSRIHGTGVKVGGSGSAIRGCVLSYCGQSGFAGWNGSSLDQINSGWAYNWDNIYELNEIHHVGWNGVSSGFEAGAGKIAACSRRTVMRRNWVHDAYGVRGLWLDGWNDDYVVEQNLVEGCGLDAIFIEINYGGVVRDNLVRDSGHPSQGNTEGGYFGNAIAVCTSSGVDVYGNVIVDCWNGINGWIDGRSPTGSQGPYTGPAGNVDFDDFHVHDNTTTWTEAVTLDGNGKGRFSGLHRGQHNATILDGRNLVFEDNTYRLYDTGLASWHYPDTRRTFAQWGALSNTSGEILEAI